VLQNRNVRLPAERVEVAVGDVFLLPLPLQADNGVNVIGCCFSIRSFQNSFNKIVLRIPLARYAVVS
jgi:hypothetical protein